MSNYIYRYEIGGEILTVESPFEYEETEPYRSFRTEKESSPCGTVYVLSEKEELPTPQGRLIFEDPNHRIYEDTVKRDGADGVQCGGNAHKALSVARDNSDGSPAVQSNDKCLKYSGTEITYCYIGFYSGGEKKSEELALAEYKKGSCRINVTLSLRASMPKKDVFVFKALGIEHFVTASGGVVLHSSSVLTKYGVILFTAPSGTGKSTQADLWQKYRSAAVLNGDNAIIKKTDGEYLFYGIPFSGSSGICRNVTAPVCAVVCLKQAGYNKARPISGVYAFRSLAEGIRADIWNTEDMNRSSDVILDLMESVPVIELCCLPDSGAVDELETYLMQLQKSN